MEPLRFTSFMDFMSSLLLGPGGIFENKNREMDLVGQLRQSDESTAIERMPQRIEVKGIKGFSQTWTHMSAALQEIEIIISDS